jgi:hypothetical protein
VDDDGVDRPGILPAGQAPQRVVVGRRSRTVPILVVASVAIVLAGLLGGNVTLPPAPVPPPPSSTVDESPGPTGSPRPLELVWTEVATDGATFRGAAVGLVISGPRGFLAFGQDRLDLHPITWTSPDGRAWTRHDQPATAFGGGVPDRAVEAGGYIAIGYDPRRTSDVRDVWLSPDGVSWHRSASRTGRGLSVAALAASGERAALLDYTFGASVAVSDDGEVWQDVPDQPRAFGVGAAVNALAATGDGFYAAGGIGIRNGGVWRSADGGRWDEVAGPSVFGVGPLRGIFRIRSGLLAVSQDYGSGTGAWSSSDGTEWEPLAGVSGSDMLDAVLPLPAVDLAIWSQRSFGGGGPSRLAVSVDLRRWWTVDAPVSGDLDWSRQLTAREGTLVAVAPRPDDTVGVWLGRIIDQGTGSSEGPSSSPSPGASSSPTPATPAPTVSPTGAPAPDAFPLAWGVLRSSPIFEGERDVWMNGIVEDGTGYLAFGQVGDDVVLWRSTDPTRWERLPASSAFAGARLSGIARMGSGYVAVGARARPGQDDHIVVWTSNDALRWAEVSSKALGTGGLNFVVAGDQGLLAMGYDNTTGQESVWFSEDARTWTRVGAELGPVSLRAGAWRSGRFVLVGEEQASYPGPRPAAWSSTDGRTWVRAEGLPSGWQGGDYYVDAALTDVVATPAGFYAVGAVGPSDAVPSRVSAVLFSPDGLTWSILPTDPAFERVILDHVATAGTSGIAVTGSTWGADPRIWISTDRRSWQVLEVAEVLDPHDPRPNATLADIVGTRDGFIAVGSRFVSPGPGSGLVLLAGPEGTIPDHPCPRIDSLRVLAGLTPADRAVCVGANAVTVDALVQRGTMCGIGLTGDGDNCGPSLDLGALSGGYPGVQAYLDSGDRFQFDRDTQSPWRITLRSGVIDGACRPPVASNGVAYTPLASARLECLAILRVVAAEPLPRP